jgi:hypothetical protein
MINLYVQTVFLDESEFSSGKVLTEAVILLR